MDFNAGATDRADRDGQSQTLEERKIHMDVEAFRLERGETIGDGLEAFSCGVEKIQALPQAEVAQVVGT